jgi:hypothetical protein
MTPSLALPFRKNIPKATIAQFRLSRRHYI